ncbi:helix-turn-helix domain-containing protein [Aquabacterium sp.]|uniref:helix-turn-helix domain-containing protein n=1 Tax=Aquabacterium sp. TaxID=1872578 RepID=UPI003784D676
MSNKITSLCRPLKMSPAQKSTLMCIADFAHDDGADWHSQAAIAEWTCLSKRAVIDAVAWLEAEGFLKIERRIGANSRTLLQLDRIELAAKQCASRTSADAAPVHQDHQCTTRTSADASGDQCSSRTTTSAVAASTSAAAAPEAPISISEASSKHQGAGGSAAKPMDLIGANSAPAPAQARVGRAEGTTARTKAAVLPKVQVATAPTRQAYVEAYRSRYGAEPVLAAKANAQLVQFVRAVGVERAPAIARFFVQSSEPFYVRRYHDVGLLLNDANKLNTQLSKGAMADRRGTSPLTTETAAKNEAAKRLVFGAAQLHDTEIIDA